MPKLTFRTVIQKTPQCKNGLQFVMPKEFIRRERICSIIMIITLLFHDHDHKPTSEDIFYYFR